MCCYASSRPSSSRADCPRCCRNRLITRFLGRSAPKAIAYPAAAAAGSLLAVCSCTIVPLFAGIYKKGAGLGPAITFLFFAPAANILALTYTGAALGRRIRRPRASSSRWSSASVSG